MFQSLPLPSRIKENIPIEWRELWKLWFLIIVIQHLSGISGWKDKHFRQFFVQFKVCYTQVSGPVQTACSNTLSSICTRHFHTLLCVHNPTKDSVIYACLYAHALQITLHCSPASCLNVSLFAHVQYLRGICTVCIFFSLCIGNHFYI